jgi:Flp pilus assembly protein TadG
MNRGSSSARHTRGSTSVETLFVLPVLLLLVFSIAEFGLAFGRYQLVIHAAHEGARVAALNRPACIASIVESVAISQAQAAVAGLGILPGDADVTVGGDLCAPGDATVTVEVDHTFPIVSALTGGSIPGNLSLAQTAIRATEFPAGS